MGHLFGHTAARAGGRRRLWSQNETQKQQMKWQSELRFATTDGDVKSETAAGVFHPKMAAPSNWLVMSSLDVEVKHLEKVIFTPPQHLKAFPGVTSALNMQIPWVNILPVDIFARSFASRFKPFSRDVKLSRSDFFLFFYFVTTTSRGPFLSSLRAVMSLRSGRKLHAI